jgi:hypothetical protein
VTLAARFSITIEIGGSTTDGGAGWCRAGRCACAGSIPVVPALCFLLFANCFLLSATLYSLLTPFCSLLSVFCSLLSVSAPCSLPPALCSLRSALCALPSALSWCREKFSHVAGIIIFSSPTCSSLSPFSYLFLVVSLNRLFLCIVYMQSPHRKLCLFSLRPSCRPHNPLSYFCLASSLSRGFRCSSEVAEP